MPKPKVAPYKNVVMICYGSDCKKKGASALIKQTKASLKLLDKPKGTMIVRSQCTGLCKKAPVMCLQPANVWLTQTSAKHVKQQIKEHLN